MMLKQHYSIEIKNLSKSYSNHAVLQDVNLNVEEGDFMAIFGPNGSGKSTLLDIIASITAPTQGTIKIMGYDLATARSKAVSCLGMMSQDPDLDSFDNIYDCIVSNTRLFGFSNKEASDRVDALLELTDLTQVKYQPKAYLSGGMQRRAMLVKALATSAPVIILDEPMVGIDIYRQKSLTEYILNLNSKGITILLTTHVIDTLARSCKNLTFMKEGRVVNSGSVQSFDKEINSISYDAQLSTSINNVNSSFIPEYVSVIDSQHIKMVVSSNQILSDVITHLRSIGISITSIRPTEEPLAVLINKFA